MLETTAIYPNRVEDKRLVERKLKLPEFGNNKMIFFFRETIVAIGYTRVVYGDHGPYVEFEQKHLYGEFLSKRFMKSLELPPENSKFYYVWLHPRLQPDCKVYWQVRDVKKLPNAPKRPDGKHSRFNRAEGYADYKRGFFYISVWDLQNRQVVAQRKRKR